jgi:hypothetical protein
VLLPVRDVPLGKKSFRGDDIDTATLAIKMNQSVNEGKKRKVASLPNPFAWVKLISHLANENVARSHALAAKPLNTTPLRVRITTVPTRALSLFVSHNYPFNDTPMRNQPRPALHKPSPAPREHQSESDRCAPDARLPAAKS